MLPLAVFAISLAFGPQIIDLSLQLDDSARQSLRRAPDTDVPATLTYQDAGREQRFAVTVHVKGQKGSARPIDDKPAFKIKLAKGERLLGLQHLTLNNMVQDPTMLREALGYEVYAAAGVAVPRTGYVRLKLDGGDQGLYLNVETIDTRFLDRVFHDSRGALYEAAYGVDLREGDEPQFELDEGADAGRARLTSFIRAVQSPGDGVFYGAAAQVDTASFLSMMAASMLLGDWDNYYSSNNYRIYWNPSTRRWHFIPTGLDQTFAADATTVFGGSGVLFQKCLASDRCTSDYARAVADVSARFERLALQTRMDALLSVIDEPSRLDPKRPYDDAAMRTARDAMRAFIDHQPAKVRASVSCLAEEGGSLSACAGEVIVSAVGDRCVELASKSGGTRGAAVGRCHGGSRQRWHLIRSDGAATIKSAASGECLDLAKGADSGDVRVDHAGCSDSPAQLFALRDTPAGTQLVAKVSGQCLAAGPAAADAKAAPLVHVSCTPDAAQTWRVQRSFLR
jgi:hypothetical protein